MTDSDVDLVGQDEQSVQVHQVDEDAADNNDGGIIFSRKSAKMMMMMMMLIILMMIIIIFKETGDNHDVTESEATLSHGCDDIMRDLTRLKPTRS